MTTPTTHTDDNFFAQLRMAQQATGETQEQVVRRIIAAVQDDVGKRPDLAMGAKSGDQLARKSVRDITLRFIQAHNDRAISEGGVRLASGVYVYRLQTASGRQTRKLVLVR